MVKIWKRKALMAVVAAALWMLGTAVSADAKGEGKGMARGHEISKDALSKGGGSEKEKEKAAKETITEHAEGSMPPGLAEKGEMPKGLEKKGKTPAGWSKGKKTGWTTRGGKKK